MTEIWRWGAAEIARRVCAGEVSARQVVDSCGERLSAVEGQIDAFLEVSLEAAGQRADELDRRRAAGETLGVLAGVPVAIKDNICVAGRQLTCGSRMLEGFVSPYSATAVARLLEQDAIIVGKTNLDEFGMGSSCENSAYRATRNPWNPGKVPGGSSGGSAAAVASSVPLALGSDTGGSIRQPAAFCGIVGLKPSYGRVSRHGLVAYASSTDQIGPLARSVDDAALALGVIAGPDPRDATCLDRPWQPGSEQLQGSEEGAAGIRVGVLQQVPEADLPVDCRRDWHAALDRLAAAGAELQQVSVPNLEAAIACYYVLASSEASANLARFDGVRYGQRGAAEDLLQLYRGSRSESLGAEVQRRILLGTFALSAGYYDAYYGRAQGVREAMRQQFDTVFEQVDVVVTPTAPSGAFALGAHLDDPLAMYLSDIFTTPASLVGLPSLAVPSGFDDAGLPLSLQITGRKFDEDTVLRLGRAFESITALEPRLPTLAALASGIGA